MKTQERWLMNFYGGPSDGMAIRAQHLPLKFQSNGEVYLLTHQCEEHLQSWYVLASANLSRITEGVLFDDGTSAHTSPEEAGRSGGAEPGDGCDPGDGGGG